MNGLDVSRWQGEIDWAELRGKHQDLRFCYLRIAGGLEGPVSARRWASTDPYAVRNLVGAQSVGLVVGGYLPFSPPRYPDPEEAAVEAYAYVHSVGLLDPGHLIPAFDIEDNTQDWSDWTRQLLTWWRRLTPQLGGRVVIYSAGSFFDSVLPRAFDRTDARVGAWVAHYSAPAPGQTRYTVGGRAIIHQHTSKGRLAGITGDVDLDATMPGAHLANWMT